MEQLVCLAAGSLTLAGCKYQVHALSTNTNNRSKEIHFIKVDSSNLYLCITITALQVLQVFMILA